MSDDGNDRGTLTRSVRVWDLPTRLLHWSLAGLLLATALIGWFGPKWMLGTHAILGYAIAGLIAFRLVWGVFGPETSRFASFPLRPRAAVAYLRDLARGRPPHHLGHNPAGAMMIYTLLGTVAALLLSGLVAFGGVEKHGPLAGVVSYAAGRAFQSLHAGLAAALITLVGLHVAGVAVSSVVERQNLARAMVTGFKRLPGEAPPPRFESARPWLGALSVAAIAAVSSGGLSALAALPPRGVPDMPRHVAYTKECGDCHPAYHPSLLPAASWKTMMAGLADHFGEDARLPAATAADIGAFLQAYAAESWDTKAANGFRHGSPAEPLRITATPYWKRTHADIAPAVFRSKAVRSSGNCNACHRDADTGGFHGPKIAIPQGVTER
ncbi:MAG: cytochrome b/b6 domain-containing protein [Candidatus Rokubacteria bacterium]|nr:cytochrome b/b6 domain-containing protein [Candidatus Rokubacteria bacterium]